MKFVLKKFLFFWDLKVFGLVMAYFGMVFSVLAAVLSIIGATILINSEKSEHHSNVIPFGFFLAESIVFELAVLLLLVVIFFFSYQLFVGVRDGIASKMKGSLFVYGFFTIGFALSMFYHLACLIGVVIFTYFWFCLFSLYVNTRNSSTIQPIQN